MADGPTNPGSIPVGGIYATVQIDTASVVPGLASVRAELVKTSDQVDAFAAASSVASTTLNARLNPALTNFVAETRGAAAAAQMYGETLDGMATKAAVAGSKIQAAGRQSNYALFQVAYAIDDVQYGLPALTNNIVGLTSAFMGSSHYVAAAAVGLTFIAVAVKNAGAAFEWFENQFKQTFSFKAPESIHSVSKEIETARKVMEELSKKTALNREEFVRYHDAERAVEKLTDKLKEMQRVQNEIETLKTGRSKGERERGQAFKDQVEEHGGKAAVEEIMEANRLLGHNMQAARQQLADAASGDATAVAGIVATLRRAAGGKDTALSARLDANATPEAIARRKKMIDDGKLHEALLDSDNKEVGDRRHVEAQRDEAERKDIGRGMAPGLLSTDTINELVRPELADEAQQKKDDAPRKKAVADAIRAFRGPVGKAIAGDVRRGKDRETIISHVQDEIAQRGVQADAIEEAAIGIVDDAIRRNNTGQAGRNVGRGQRAAGVGRRAGGRIPNIRGAAGGAELPRVPLPPLPAPKLEIAPGSIGDDKAQALLGDAVGELKQINRGVGKMGEGVPAVLG